MVSLALDMYFDALTLTAVADELRAALVGGRIQRVLLPDAASIGLEIYAHRQRRYLLASAHPGLARVHLVGGKLSRGGDRETPLLLLLRKYLLGGRIVSLEQPPLERILLVSIVKETETCNHPSGEGESAQGETGEQGSPGEADFSPSPGAEPLTCELVIETMDRRSNIILVDENNLILDSVRRVPARVSRRVVLPRHVYELPPRQEKSDPATANADEVQRFWKGDSGSKAKSKAGKMIRSLVGGYRGVSPQVAREAAHRAGWQEPPPGAVPDHAAYEAVAAALRNLFLSPWEPTLATEHATGAGEEHPRAYAPYRLTHLEGSSTLQAYPSMNGALEAFYAAQQELTHHQQRRDEVQHKLAEGRKRLEHQRNQLRAEQERARSADQLRWEGEMIYAFLHTIEPGQETLEMEGREIAIDPQRSAVEQAQERFRAYEKARSGQVSVAERLQATETALAGLEEIAALLDLASEREQIEQLEREAAEQGYLGSGYQQSAKQRQKKRQPARLKPLRIVSSDGVDIYVGRSATQNAEVTFRIGRPDDLWLHIHGMPGAHVIVRSGGKPVPECTLLEAAGLAAYFSRARGEARADVDVARRSLVRKVRGGPPGLVTYRAERTVRVAPRAP
jgi:predicted ribosome quality control (RQC) complex YloA/Tae2 family protein